MAKCAYCELEMSNDSVVSCTANAIIDEFPDGIPRPAIPYTGEERCRDCNVATGGFHHPGCDSERCPICGGQIISCECLE